MNSDTRFRWWTVLALVFLFGLAGVVSAQEEPSADTEPPPPDSKEQLAGEREALEQTTADLAQATNPLEKEVLTREKQLHAGRVEYLELQIALAEKASAQTAALEEAEKKKAELETALADLKKRADEGTVTFTPEEARQAQEQAKEAEADLEAAEATLTARETELESIDSKLTRVQADAQAALKRSEEVGAAVQEQKAQAADDGTRALLDRQLAAERAFASQAQQMVEAMQRQRELAKKGLEVAQVELDWHRLANDLAQQRAQLAAQFITVTQEDVEQAAEQVEEKKARAEEAKAEAEEVKEEVAATKDELQKQLTEAQAALEQATTEEERAPAGKTIEALEQKLEVADTQAELAQEQAVAEQEEVEADEAELKTLEEEATGVEEAERIDRAEQARRAAEEARTQAETYRRKREQVELELDRLYDRVGKARKDLEKVEGALAEAPGDPERQEQVRGVRENLDTLQQHQGLLMARSEALRKSIKAGEDRAEAQEKRARELGANLWTRTLDYLRSQYDSGRRQAGRIGRKMVPGLGWIIFTFIVCKLASLLVRVVFDLTGAVTRTLQRFRMDVRRMDTISGLIKSALSYVIYFAGFLFVLKKMEVNTTPVVAAVAGMLAVGVGFGSQNLVRDLVTGLFLLLEGQLVVGDFVDAGGSVGFVEEVSIRTTRIREISGEVRILPNGRITAVRRFPKGYADAQVDIFLAKNDSVPKARSIIDDLAGKLDQELEVVLKVPEFVEVGNQGQPDVFLRYVIRTLPTQDWVAKTEFTNRLKAAFAAEGIELNNNMIRIVFMADVQVFRRRLGRFRRLVSQIER